MNGIRGSLLLSLLLLLLLLGLNALGLLRTVVHLSLLSLCQLCGLELHIRKSLQEILLLLTKSLVLSLESELLCHKGVVIVASGTLRHSSQVWLRTGLEARRHPASLLLLLLLELLRLRGQESLHLQLLLLESKRLRVVRVHLLLLLQLLEHGELSLLKRGESHTSCRGCKHGIFIAAGSSLGAYALLEDVVKVLPVLWRGGSKVLVVCSSLVLRSLQRRAEDVLCIRRGALTVVGAVSATGRAEIEGTGHRCVEDLVLDFTESRERTGLETACVGIERRVGRGGYRGRISGGCRSQPGVGRCERGLGWRRCHGCRRW